MASSAQYLDYVCEKLQPYGAIRTKKMFGEYLVYLNDKPILTVCDNTVFVKKLPQLSDIMKNSDCGFPYDGAKECYILDIENDGLIEEVIPKI